MSEAIFMLRLEHANIAKLLRLVEDQLQRIEGGGPVDQSLLLLAYEYLSGYPDACHHPKEDLVFRKLQRRDPGACAALVDLAAEHEELGQLTERFGHDAREAGGASDAGAGALVESMRRLLGFYKGHMTREEREFFPTALRCLTRTDLAEIDFDLFDRQDPLFHHEAEQKFDRLRHEIAELAVATTQLDDQSRSSFGEDEANLLRRMKSVAEFNREMQSREMHLTPYPSGGYALEAGGRWLLDIPDCGEAQAVWCAYYYLKGVEDDGGP